MSAEERRTHGRSPWREAYEMLALRPARAVDSSVSITRNAKGVAQFEVVVHGPDAWECLLEAQAIYNDLARNYPYPLEGAVSPQEPFAVRVDAQAGQTFWGRSRARRTAETA